MRIAMMVAALGLVLGAPAMMPADLIEEAAAQDTVTNPLVAELIAAGDDLNLLNNIITRELSDGNYDGLATGLAGAASAQATTDLALSATLISQAIAVASAGSDETQREVGAAASIVATVANRAGDQSALDMVDVAVRTSLDADLTDSYDQAGGSTNQNVPTTTTETTDTTDTTTTTDDTTTTTDDDTTTTGDDTTTTGDDTTTTTTDTTTTTTDTTTPTGDTSTPTDDVNQPTGAITPPTLPGGQPPQPPNTGGFAPPTPFEPPQATGGSPV